MRIGKIEVRRRVGVGLLFALVAIGAWWAWTDATKPRGEAIAHPKQPFVRLADSGSGPGNQLLREQTEYFDPTPLFFPTGWNYGQGPLREILRREPEQVFGSFEAKLTFTESNFQALQPEVAGGTNRLADVLAQGNERPLGGLGQIDLSTAPLNARSGFIEISSFSDGIVVVNQSFADVSLLHPEFGPLEFIAVVSSAGLVGEPALVSGSGWEEVDSQLRTYLVKTFRLGERLNPGRYRVVIGP